MMEVVIIPGFIHIIGSATLMLMAVISINCNNNTYIILHTTLLLLYITYVYCAAWG